MALTYTLIASNTLGSNAASVTFSSIPGTYTDLVVRSSIRTDNSNLYDGISVRFNGDTASNYSYTVLRGTGIAADSFRGTSQTISLHSYQDGNTSTSNTFGSGELYIPSYTASQNKPFSSFSVQENNGADAWMSAIANLWRNTAAITSLVLAPTAGTNFLSGSSFWLYGISSTV